jgi:hypothetical protein
MFDRKKCQVISAEVAVALAPIATRHGLTIDVRGGRFDSTTFTPKIVFNVADGGRLRFEQWAKALGLQPTDFGRQFSFGGKTYTISDVNPNALRSVGATRDGKTYFWKASDIKKLLGPEVVCP